MCSNGIAKVDIHGVLEFVRGREDFVELVRRHMGDDCAQLVRELTQEVKAAEGNAFYEGFRLCYQRIERVLAGDEKIAGTLREVMRQAEREYRWAMRGMIRLPSNGWQRDIRKSLRICNGNISWRSRGLRA